MKLRHDQSTEMLKVQAHVEMYPTSLMLVGNFINFTITRFNGYSIPYGYTSSLRPVCTAVEPVVVESVKEAKQ